MRIHFAISKAILLTGVVSVCSTGAIQTAAARSAPADVGRAAFSEDEHCFDLWFSGVQNTCSTRKSYEMPLVIDQSGSKTVHVMAFGANSSQNVQCQAVGTSNDLNSVFRSGTRALPAFGSPQTIVLSGASVPSSGRLYVNCNVDPRAAIYTLNWPI